MKAHNLLVTGGAGFIGINFIRYVFERTAFRGRAINCAKAERELGWTPRESFETGLAKTVDWYLSHRDWVASVRSGEYRQWIRKQYGQD